MRSFALPLLALAALAACDGGTQSAETSTAEAEADGNLVANSSASKPSDAGEAADPEPTTAATPTPEEEASQ